MFLPLALAADMCPFLASTTVKGACQFPGLNYSIQSALGRT